MNTDNPLETGDSLFGGIADLARDSSQRIVVDISTFTHESLLMLLRVLYITRQCVNVTLLYSKATEYSIGDRPENKWLSKGVGEIRSVLGFPGRVYPSRALHLIVLVGLEYQRTIDIVGRYEPTEISLGYGRTGDLPSTDDIGHHGFWKVHAIYEGAREFTFSPLDPIAARRKISDQVKRTDGYNVIVAPMNTKLSTIAAGLVACENDNVQLCYAKALVYNYHNYSRPGEEVFVVELEGEDRDNL
ncbi:MAG TPA: hypothetical protein VHQ90_11765 [Thermoanaerobaculia bacterium]|nr:hypothetical protein [Thermoanaerobaculia bacterium]